MTSRKLHMVRHGPVNIDLSLASSEWELAPGSSPSILRLADRLRGCGLRRVVASSQRKAKATARNLADTLALPMEVHDGLEEHHRLEQQQSSTEEEFRSNMRRFFGHPSETLFGSESASAALTRFHGAVSGIMAGSGGNEVIVSHGTVISLLAALGGNGKAEDIWASLRLPDHLVFDWPSLALDCRQL